MASSAVLECSICCERFDDGKLCPRLLSCGHSFCSGCLEKLSRGKAINCPTCRKTISVPAGIAGLPKNFALLDVILATPLHVGDESLHICEACDDEQHPAKFCCLDCKEDMCKDAARWHTRNKANRDHRVVSLEELKANPKLAAVPVFCPEHNEQFRFFDEECNHVVCRDCVTLKHNGHKCLSLAEAASKYRHEMQALANKAVTHAEEITAAEVRIEGVRRDLKKAYEKQATQIQCTFEELHAALAAREQVLMNQLDLLHKAKAVTLTEQQDCLRIFQACLQSAVQRTMSTVQSPGDAELLVARSNVVATLESLEIQPLVLDPQTDSVLEFNITHKQLLDVINSTGTVIDKSTRTATTAAVPGLKHVRTCNDSSFTITADDAQECIRGPGGDLLVVELKEELVVNKVELKRSKNEWVKPSELSKSGNEAEKKDKELYCNVRSILNKLTPQMFQTLTQQIIDLDIDTVERLEGTVGLIFEKAIDEAEFSVAYANMCRCLVPKKIVVEKDGIQKKTVTFRKLLLNRCQEEFENEKSAKKRARERLEALTKQEKEDLQMRKEELLDEEHRFKRRKLGNIRLIGELFKLKMLTGKIMHESVSKLLIRNDDESFECLCKLLATVGKDLDQVKDKPKVDGYFAKIRQVIQARITSSRVRFMMEDIVDLRNNDWVPRREDNNPKTIDQIHREAADQDRKYR